MPRVELPLDECRWCKEPSVTNYNPTGELWIALDMASSGWVACGYHLVNAVGEAHANNLDNERAVQVYLYKEAEVGA